MLLLCVPLVAALWPSRNPTPATILKHVKSAYAAMKSYSDVEVGEIGDANHVGSMTGKIVVKTRFKRPNRIRVEVLGSVEKRPVHIAIWSSSRSRAKFGDNTLVDSWNGSELKRKVTMTEMYKNFDGGSDDAIELMADLFFDRYGLLDLDFDWWKIEKHSVNGHRCFVLSGGPITKGFRSTIEVSVDVHTWLVRKIYFRSEYDNMVELTCHSNVNPVLTERGFTFHPPRRATAKPIRWPSDSWQWSQGPFH